MFKEEMKATLVFLKAVLAYSSRIADYTVNRKYIPCFSTFFMYIAAAVFAYHSHRPTCLQCSMVVA